MNLPPVRYVDVTDNIVMMEPLNEGLPNEGNMTCLSIDKDLIFIDATGIKALAAKFRADMEAQFKKKASYLFLTHFHQDHVFGLGAFEDITTIGTQTGLDEFRKDLKGEYTKDHREKQVEEWKNEIKEQGRKPTKEWEGWAENYKNAELFSPKIGVKNKLTTGNSDQQLTFEAVGGHSECSAYLYYEPDQILFTGDNLNAEHAKRSPCFFAGVIMELEKGESLKILRKFEEMAVKKVVPGHGPVLDPSYVKETRDYFTKLITKLQAFKAEGVPTEDAINHPELPPFYEKEKPKYLDQILTMWYDGSLPSPD